MSLSLITNNIRKSYNGDEVLKDCSFSFNERGIYILTGPNGSGKSTLLRICSLLEQPDSGEITFFSGGEEAEKDLNLRRRISLVLPRVGVFNTTVFRNVAYGLTIRGIRGEEAECKVLQALDFVGLAHKRDQAALSLSSGETRRLGLARALIIEPEMLFLDEPTASVDQRNCAMIEEGISEMKAKGAITIIMTTHDQKQAERLADKLLVITDGKTTTLR